MPPIATIYFERALALVESQILADDDVKDVIFDALFEIHQNGTAQEAAVRLLDRRLDGLIWQWPEGESAAAKQGFTYRRPIRGCLSVLVNRIRRATYQFMRRDQLERLRHNCIFFDVVVIEDFSTIRRYKTSACPAPCGMIHKTSMPIAQAPWDSLPPCSDVDCACSWQFSRARS